MRGTWMCVFAVVAGCSSESLDAPDDCNPGELHLAQGGVEERTMVGSFGFVNAFGGNTGSFTVGGQTPIVTLAFTKLTADGDIADVRGYVASTTIAGGNCETGGYTSRLLVADGYWRFEVADAHEMPYCSGLAVGNVTGCYRSSN